MLATLTSTLQDAATDSQNAVVIAAPDATFLETWLRSYLEFRHDLYEYNGVIKPWVRYSYTPLQLSSNASFRLTARLILEAWMMIDIAEHGSIRPHFRTSRIARGIFQPHMGRRRDPDGARNDRMGLGRKRSMRVSSSALLAICGD